jgi:hypothetical protein
MRPQGGIAQSTQADSIVKQLFIVPEFSVGRLVGRGRCLTSHRKRHYSWSFKWLPLTDRIGSTFISLQKGVPHEKTQVGIYFLIIAWVAGSTAGVLRSTNTSMKMVRRRWTDDLSQVPTATAGFGPAF